MLPPAHVWPASGASIWAAAFFTLEKRGAMTTVLVIGAGIGGLAVAGRLAKSGS
jgi:hypothetical protein